MAGGGVKVNNVTIRGGADGATFIPSVDANGNLSWSNNKGYTNPVTVNIKGADGQNGTNGQDGATGAKLISQVLQGQDANGGNIYLQTFDDGTTATFTAPKGVKGDKGDKGDTGDTPDLSDYVLKSTTIAGFNLSQNISANELLNALFDISVVEEL